MVKITTSVIITGLLIVSILAPVMASGGKAVYGMLYLVDNDTVITPDTNSDILVRLEKPDGSLIAETYVCDPDNGSNYLLAFSSDYSGIGYFNISMNGEWYHPYDNKSIIIDNSWIGKRVNLHIDISKEEEESTGGSSNSHSGLGGGGVDSSSENLPPIAVIEVNRTIVLVDQPILFNGSHSTDDHGIVNYTWNFGDGTKDYGAIVTHSFSEPGRYNVILIVKDGEGLSDDDTVAITVTERGNYPPENLVVDGPTNGDKNTSYTYTATATDPDGDSIKYYFDWGDETTSESTMQPSGVSFEISHSWDKPGVYTVKVYAEDRFGAKSSTVTFTMTIDAHPAVSYTHLTLPTNREV